jgi:arabinan endo-1,5-alpha-L-arabinosidase
MKYPVSMHRLSRFVSRQLYLGFLAVCLLPGWLQAAPPNLRGSLGVHDPSTMIKCNGRYFVFSTGQGISSKSSADKEYWVTGPSVFASPPSWTTAAVPGFAGNFWAPDIVFTNGLYRLYYSVSTFGKQISAIGLVTSPTLDPTDPNYLWTDQGAVILSTNGLSYNCIDPSILIETNGNMWMAFGSFWTGIKLIQLNPATGKRITPNSTVYSLAYNSAIEAACLYQHGNYYYLFVNWDACCAGINSTYNVRIGRSTSVTGPYLDRNGVDLLSNGGTLFLKTTGKYLGPGHVGILNENGTEHFGYHYYDANANGASTYDFEPLYWTPDGWPAFTNDWAAVYRFQFDGRDDHNQYYSLIQNGAYVRNDPLLGEMLVLNGTNQYVNLPDGAANACTFAAVFNWNGGADRQRILDFGRATNKYAFLTPRNGATGKIRFTITASGAAGEQVLDAPGAAPVGTWTHVAVTTDGTRGILYVNGTPVATNTSMTLTAPDLAPTNTWFGRSPFTADPYFNGQLGSLRIYGRALSAGEIVAPQPVITAPPAGSTYPPGGTLQFAGTATDFADTPLSITGLTWTVEFRDANTTNIVAGPLAGVGGGSYTVPTDGPQATNGFHRIILVTADMLGRTATNYVDVLPNPTNTDWAAFYPFDNAATDANGFFDGSLVNGATTPSDSIRGSVLNLSGSSQYVSLPAGVGALRTFAGWVKWGGGTAWQRIFDFGTGTNSYAMLTPKASNGRLRFEITPKIGEARQLDAPYALPTNVWTHVAVTLDGRQAVMFVNGQAVAVNASVNLLPADVLGSADYLGRSQYTADSYFQGQMDSVQIASQTLPIEQITTASIGLSHTVSNLTLNWPAWTNGLGLYSATNLMAEAAWTPVASLPVKTNGVSFVTLAPTNRQMFFRLQLP